MDNEINSIISFIKKAEQAKNELRHSWTSIDRQESIADHSWRVSLILIVCSPYFPENFDLLKSIKMAILHDLGEIVVGDMHFLEVNKSKDQKFNRSKLERSGVIEVCKSLAKSRIEILEIWEEFEENKSSEAQVVNCLDRIEVCIQHSQSNLSKWTEDEINSIGFYFSKIDEPFPFLKDIKEAVKQNCLKKISDKL